MRVNRFKVDCVDFFVFEVSASRDCYTWKVTLSRRDSKTGKTVLIVVINSVTLFGWHRNRLVET
jgi:hypothetical protein